MATIRTGWLPQIRVDKPWRPRRGLWVALLGPDGVGKSSVIAALGHGELAGFAACRSYHLRPTLLRSRKGRANTCPHATEPRSLVVSAAKLLHLLLANWLGYLLAVRGPVARGNLVLMDRYFHDCLVDERRYRLPKSCRGLAKLVARLVPQPDLLVLLDAPTEILQMRKGEVTWGESERQRIAYRELGRTFPNACIVSSAGPLAEALDSVVDCIIEARLAAQRPGYRPA